MSKEPNLKHRGVDGGMKRTFFRVIVSLFVWSVLTPALLQKLSADSTDNVVALQEFVVEATPLSPHPWHYVRVGEYEILSQCDDDQTEAVAQHIASSFELDRRSLPPVFWGEPRVPLTFVMFDFKPAKSLSAFVPKSIQANHSTGDFGKVILQGNRSFNDVELLLNQGVEKDGGVAVGGSDTYCVVQNRWKSSWNWSGGAYARGPIPLAVHFRLSRRVPPMPAWFEYGLVGPCGLFRRKAVRDPKSGIFRGEVVVSGATWLTNEQNAAIVKSYKDYHRLPDLPPVANLFLLDITSRTSFLSDWPSAEYMAEAALFVRWGLMPVAEVGRVHTSNLIHPVSLKQANALNEAHRKAFATFVERTRTKVATEEVFRECFGFGYEKLQAMLSAYLVTTAQEPFYVNREILKGWSPDEPLESVRRATADEIGRIIGDWLRMQANALRTSNPEEASAYLRAAGRVLETAFRESNGLSPLTQLSAPSNLTHEDEKSVLSLEASGGQISISPARIRDPRLLAVYGLYYLDTGDSVSAEILIRAAIKADVDRPSVYMALAKLNRATALSHPESPSGTLSPIQIASILTPLFTVMKTRTLDIEGYLLIADAWLHSATKPSLSNLEVLEDGLMRHPFDLHLICCVARVYGHWRYLDKANEIASRIAQFPPTTESEELKAEQLTWVQNK